MMSLSTLLLTLVVSEMAQSTLLESQCDKECYVQSKVETQMLFATKERNICEVNTGTCTCTKNKELEQEVQTQKDMINQLQAEILELKSKNQTDVDNNVYQDCFDFRGLPGLGYKTNGVYEVNIGNGKTKYIYCEMEMTYDGQRWTRILHRQDNKTDFTYKNWTQYEAGFGDPRGSHWMGLAYMHRLMTFRPYKLRVDLTDWDGNTAYAEYSIFHVGPASAKYELTIGGYNGTAGNSIVKEHVMNFTTIDEDNNIWFPSINGGNCADGTGYRTGGWWYEYCPALARLTGPYIVNGTNVTEHHGIQWPTWRGYRYSYKVATMKMQRLH